MDILGILNFIYCLIVSHCLVIIFLFVKSTCIKVSEVILPILTHSYGNCYRLELFVHVA